MECARLHPGEILREKYLVPLDMSVHALSLALRVSATLLHEIVKECRSSNDSDKRVLHHQLNCVMLASATE